MQGDPSFTLDNLPPPSYQRKYKKLKRFIKDTVFQNAAICDEVIRVEEQFNTVQEESRFLLRKVLQYERARESTGSLVPIATPKRDGGSTQLADATSRSKVKRKTPQIVKPGIGESPDLPIPPRSKVKRGKASALKKTVPLLPLDEFGRPVLPLEMGELTVHSLGEIAFDKASFHCTESIYPIGFCSTRVYASNDDMYTSCLYTCKISDNETKPLFEVSPEDNPDDIHSGDSPRECLASLIQSLSITGNTLVPTHTDSLAFFGLTHPVVQNLIQSCPGSKKCTGYRWVKFEINRDLAPDFVETDENTPTVSYQYLIGSLSK